MANTREVEIITGIETPTQPAAQDPQNDGDLITKGFADKNYQQGTAKRESIADVKAIAEADRKDGDKVWVQQIQSEYFFDSASAATGDDDFVLVPDSGTGRWLLDSVRNKQLNLTDTTNSTDKDTGAIVTEGGVGIEKDLSVGGVLRVDTSATINNLTTTGTTTFANSTEVEITDAKVTYNKNGTQATANLNEAGFEVDMSDATNAGIGYNSALASKFNVGEDGSRSEIVNTGADQNVTGLKKFEREVELEAITTPAGNPATGLKLYAKSDDKLYIKNSSGGETEVGTGGGGAGSVVGLTQFLAENFDTSVAAALAYDDGASATPTDGTGAGGAGLTASLETVTPINGAGSLRVAKDAANRQGQGRRFDFTVIDSFKNTLLPMRFLWRTDSAYVDGDKAVFIYDVDNATLLNGGQPFVTLNKSTTDATIDFAWSSTDSSNYRLLLHQASTTAVATTYFVDDLVSETQAVKQGAIITDWKDFTVNWTNAGTIGTEEWRYRRVGETMELQGTTEFTGTGTAATLRFDIPDGLNAEITAVNVNKFGRIGVGGFLDSSGGTPRQNANFYLNDSRTITFHTEGLAAVLGNELGAGDVLNGIIQIPIQEWTGSGIQYQLNSDVVKQNTRLRYTKNDAQSFTSGSTTIIVYDDVDFDESLGQYNSSTGVFTASVQGTYRVSASLLVDSNPTQPTMFVHKNGSIQARRNHLDGDQVVDIDTLVQLDVGDTIDARFVHFTGSNRSNSTNPVYNSIVIERSHDFNSKSAVGFGHAKDGNAGLVEFYKTETVDVTGSGAFTTGELRLSRINNVVTVQVSANCTHASAAQAVSAVGLIPTDYRPDNSQNTARFDGSGHISFQVNTDGSFQQNYRDFAGSTFNRTAGGILSITYSVN